MKWLFLLLLSFNAYSLPSSWKFRTLRTEHFDIIYRADQKEMAQLYANAAEHSYELLIPIFQEAPSRTVIALRDDTDIANGLATFLPYPMIIVNPVLPGPGESISDYGDWAFELILHEYTHILNMHPAHGFYVPLKWIFGGVVRPNGVLPRWYQEGLAVETESRFSEFGRLRSPEFGAALRALFEGKRFDEETVDKINEVEIPTWPYGNRPYLLGSAWWHTAAKDLSTIQDLNQRFSRRLPFLLNGPVEDKLNKDVEGVLDSTYSELKKAAANQLQVIELSGGEHLQRLEGDGSSSQHLPTLSPNGLHLLFLATVYKQGGTIKLTTRFNNNSFDLKTATVLARTMGTSRLSWLPDSKSFVFDQIDIKKPHVQFSDLYLFRLEDRHIRRLSIGLRATEPSVSPLGERVAYVRFIGGRDQIGVLDLKSLKTQMLYKAGPLERLSQPVFLADQIYFLSRDNRGQDSLMSYNLANKAATKVALPLGQLKSLAAVHNGLLIGSAETGASNIYWWKNFKTLVPVTNTKTQIHSAVWDDSRKELLVSRLTSEGSKLHVQTGVQPTKPPVLNPIYNVPAAPARPTAPPAVEELSYQPLRYLLPRYWIPAVYPIEGGMLFQGETFSSDPIGRNTYALSGAYDTVTAKTGYGLAYTNSSWPIDIELSHAKYQSYLGASELTLENQNAGLGLSFFPFSRNKFWRTGLSGHWQQTTGDGFGLKRMGPGAFLAYSRLEDPLSTWGWAALIKHQEYLQQDGYIDYGISTGMLALKTKAPFFDTHRISVQMRGAVAPQMPFGAILALGERNLGANYLVNLTGSDFLLRGYPSGTFIGRKVVNGNFEYQFPLGGIWGSSGTLPLFFKDINGVLFYDTMAVDGAAFRPDDNPDARGYYRSHLGEFYGGTGGEIRLNLTAAYHLPVTITAGFYYGLKEQYGGGFTQFLGFTYDGLGSLEH